jgi:hypothetical protein
MKRRGPPERVPNAGSILAEQCLDNGAPPATAVLVGKIPKEPPPLPSLFELVKSRFGLLPESEAPSWARCAANMAFDSLVPPHRRRKRSEAYDVGFDSGYVQGAAEVLACNDATPPGEPAMRGCSEIVKQFWATQPADKAADFFCGFRDGEKLMRNMTERARQMAQRTKIYRALAARWKEIAPGVLHSTGELHQWLLCQKVILPGTDSSEVRLVCSKIGLRYKRPGKPPKS